MDFNIKPPKTMRKDFENYLADRAALNRIMESGEFAQEEYRSAVRSLEILYAGKIHQEDEMLFDDEKGFSKFLDYLVSKNPKNEEILRWTLQHEREHYKAIINDPAIKAQYCFWILQEDDGNISGLPAVSIQSLKDENHYIEARKRSIKAAAEPSPGDKLEL